MSDLANKRIVIAGPTGIGKTASSLELVRTLRDQSIKASIISADSRQCYKYLDIGTGKVTIDEMGDIRHFNISIFEPDQNDTAAAFVDRSRQWETKIRAEGEIPIYVGGSTLHLQSLIWPLDDIPGACVYNQIKLTQQEKEFGQDFILDKLKKIDPEYYAKVEGYNRNRVFRALDVYMQSGIPFSQYHSERDFTVVPNDTLLIVLTCDRNTLKEFIDTRVDKMIDNGLVNETSQILKMGYSPTLQALQTVGYKETIDFLDGIIDHTQMVSLIKISTRQYAKRQQTWFRRWKSAIVIDTSGKNSQMISDEILMHYFA